MIENDYYFVDKMLFIKELLDNGGYVNLFTRPRRLGKTLALSMLQTFFELDMDVHGNVTDNSSYFDGMKIMQAGDKYTSHIGKYPVITLSLKSGKQPTFEMAHQSLIDEIINEYVRHRYVLLGDRLISSQKEKYQLIMDRKADLIEYAYFSGFYHEMIGFIRSLFESALKTNTHLAFAVVTGCLRISKESIFTGLNNLEIISILNPDFSEHFGFTQNEVTTLLKYYGIEDKLDEVTQWYNGYIFGNTQVYNPWSIINYTKALHNHPTAFPKPYWSNTSSNSIVRELIENADDATKADLENLIAGGTIEVQMHEDITYDDIHKTKDNLWNFLFFTGYLKAIDQRFEVDAIYLTLQIPNMEIRYIYRNTIKEWFTQKVAQADFTPLYQAILDGDCHTIEDYLIKQLSASISYHDSAENFYHEYVLGVLSAFSGYAISSNKEHGDGRPDIVLCPHAPRKSVIIIEIKKTDKYISMEKLCDEAITQINEKRYADEYLEEGFKGVMKYGICFCKKSCIVKTAY